MFERLNDLGIKFVMEIRNNRIVHRHGKKFINCSVKKFFSTFKKSKIKFRSMAKWASSACVNLKKSQFKLKTVAVANKKGMTNEPFSYYVSNQLT